MKNKLGIGLAILGIIIIISAIVFFAPSCCSFKPIWNDKLPPECNMSLNAMQIYHKSADKSGSVPSTEACYKCLHRLRCQAEVFGVNDKGEPKPVDYGDAVKYRNYEQCRSELK